ncbi:hypothetical protein GQ600_12185 [Phytophthora cactorum]|nr:hypothetical protein GQ600_12185 [Phytophthora cactorum]
MVSTTSILALTAAVATTVEYIEPQWKGGWDQSKGDEGLLSTFKELSAANNYKDVRSLMDGNPVYGEDCGFTDPKGTPVDPPTDGTATFSRGIVHAGPCEIWLDDKMVLQNDDCQSAYGDGTQATIAVFKPVDYSSCASGGCLLRFYWLALQRLDGKTVWQAYKNCIPLTGPAGGGASQQTPSTGGGSDTSQKTPDEDVSQTSPSTGDSSKKSDSDSPASKSDSPSSGDSDSPASKSDTPSGGDSESPSSPATPAPETPSADTPEMAPAPAPSSKCNGRLCSGSGSAPQACDYRSLHLASFPNLQRPLTSSPHSHTVMVSTTSIVVVASAIAMSANYVQAHGYVENPESEFKDKKTSEWMCRSIRSGRVTGTMPRETRAWWLSTKSSRRPIMPRTSARSSPRQRHLAVRRRCGYTNPDVSAKDPPTDGTATFSRGIVHAGPCEIWLDDKMVLQNDDCQSAYGDGTQETISVFKPVDYSSCASGGCMFRFYWLALQRLDGKTYWQVYKNCIPLSGPAGGGASQITPSTGDGSGTSQTSPSSGEADGSATTAPTSGASESTNATPAPSPRRLTHRNDSSPEQQVQWPPQA